MTINCEEFIRRFLMHVLPDNFTKIKHYGILTNRSKSSLIKLCRILIGQKKFNDFTISLKRKIHEFICPMCSNNTFNYSYFYKRSYN